MVSPQRLHNIGLYDENVRKKVASFFKSKIINNNLYLNNYYKHNFVNIITTHGTIDIVNISMVANTIKLKVNYLYKKSRKILAENNILKCINKDIIVR